MKLTELEQKFMRAIPKDDFYEHGYESCLWSDVFFDGAGIDPKVGRGVLSSLIKKGLLKVTMQDSFELDDEGAWWLQANLAMDDEGYEF